MNGKAHESQIRVFVKDNYQHLINKYQSLLNDSINLQTIAFTTLPA